MGDLGAIVSSMGNDGSSDAAMIMAAASINFQKYMYNQNRNDMMPWMNSARDSLGQLNALMQPGGGLDPNARFKISDMQSDPGYAFRQQAGVNAISAAGAAGGSLGSGNMGVALQNFGQTLASDEYGNAFNRWQGQRNNEFNQLAGLSNPGAVQQVGQWGIQTGQGVGNTMMSAGQFASNAQMQQNQMNQNMWNRAGTNAGNAIMGGIGMYNQNQMFQDYLNGGSSGLMGSADAGFYGSVDTTLDSSWGSGF